MQGFGALITARWMSIGLGVLVFCIVYVMALVLYRLIFSPIARFPGPRMAAATASYEFYYDVLKPGKYYQKINELHDIYGEYCVNGKG
jgi:hypothetical protein